MFVAFAAATRVTFPVVSVAKLAFVPLPNLVKLVNGASGGSGGKWGGGSSSALVFVRLDGRAMHLWGRVGAVVSTSHSPAGWAGDAPGADRHAWRRERRWRRAAVEGRAVEPSAHDGAFGLVESGRVGGIGAIGPERRIGHVALRRRRRSELKERGLTITAASEAIRVIERHRDCYCEWMGR